MKAGPPLVHAFDLRAPGTGTVTITKVEAGCGCLRQSRSATTLARGQKTTLTLEVNTLHAAGRTQPLAGGCLLT